MLATKSSEPNERTYRLTQPFVRFPTIFLSTIECPAPRQSLMNRDPNDMPLDQHARREHVKVMNRENHTVT